MMEFFWRKTSAELRRFGLTIGVLSALLGGLLLWRGRPTGPYFLGGAGIVVILALLSPRALAPLEWLWMRMAAVLAAVMTRVILTLTFYLVITPVGLIQRIMGHDPLRKKFDSGVDTYWDPVDPEGPTGRPDRPF